MLPCPYRHSDDEIAAQAAPHRFRNISDGERVDITSQISDQIRVEPGQAEHIACDSEPEPSDSDGTDDTDAHTDVSESDDEEMTVLEHE